MEKERILKDIKLFEENVKSLENNKIVDMAKRYYVDAKYYLSKGDFFTAFGCINYAHGLIDALRMEGFKDEKTL
ncbi:MAG: DUF357 domain-containing protein [Thermoplasmata archaeon]|nr:MAG: DUF357 domain-containing protein [Thermoplasmata archaeon]RLF63814.1 MAG: DUF357 domain-containing protein [Thermoplasmata archaeon]HDM22974.1 DUF357 domain-containing protein [Methanomicrobia archaeon]